MTLWTDLDRQFSRMMRTSADIAAACVSVLLPWGASCQTTASPPCSARIRHGLRQHAGSWTLDAMRRGRVVAQRTAERAGLRVGTHNHARAVALACDSVEHLSCLDVRPGCSTSDMTLAILRWPGWWLAPPDARWLDLRSRLSNRTPEQLRRPSTEATEPQPAGEW